MMAAAALVALAGAFQAPAQETTGSVRGEVTDVSGAVIASAAIELHNVASGTVLRQASDAEGRYVFNFVPPGTYMLRVAANGFQTLEVKGVKVEVYKSTVINAQLHVGAVTESVEVSSTATGIDTVSARVGTNVDQKYILQLPSSTRNVLTFAELAPGVTLVRPGSQVMSNEGSYANVNGQRQGSNTFYLDGSDNSGSFRNGSLQFPNPETIQEVQVSTANTSAEFGKQPGGVFNVITKSGTNLVHGSGFYFFRNTALNANTYDRNRSGTPKAEDNIKQGGGTIGGPIKKNKSFFFGSMMFYRDRTPQFQNTRRFLTTAMAAGDFSQFTRPLYDPDTGQPLPGNRIPSSLLDPVALRLNALLPTVTNYGDRYLWAYDDVTRNQEALAKLDHNFSDRHQMAISYFRTFGDQRLPAPGGGSAPGFGPQINDSSQNTFSARYLWIMTPTLVLQSRFALAHHSVDRNNAQTGRNLEDFGALWPISSVGARKYLPQLTVSDGFTTSQGTLGLFQQRNYRGGATLSWTKRRHNLKFGIESQRDSVLQRNDQDATSFAFDGRSSSRPLGGAPTGIGVFGYAAADFLMGRASSFSTRGLREYDISSRSYFFFAQDEWKLTPRLTLTPGLRYEFNSPAQEAKRRLSAFLLGHKSTTYPNAPVHLAFPGDQGVPEGMYSRDFTNFGPRLGLACDPLGDGKTAIRAGAGYYYSFVAAQPKMILGEQTPWNPSAGGGETRSLVDPWGTSRTIVYTKPPTPFSTDISTFQYPSTISPARGFNPRFRTPYVLQWNLAIERELWKSWTIQAAYVGNRGFKLIQIEQLNYARWQDNASLGNIELRRPVKGYGVADYISSSSRSWHDALQLSADARLRASFRSRFTYVFGRTFALVDEDIGRGSFSAANPTNINTEKAEIARRHTFRAFYVYELPRMHGGRSLTALLLAGWQVSGSILVFSGSPVNVTLGQDWNFDGIGEDRPDIIAPIVYTSGSRDAKMRGYFSRASFAQPPVRNTFGSLRRNALIGPGQWSADLALVKELAVAEGKLLQLRAEGYNIFNHNNLSNPNGNMSSADFTRILTRFGNRTMQIGVRFSF